MERIILTKTAGSRGFVLFKKKKNFWFVSLYYSQNKRDHTIHMHKLKHAMALTDPELAKIRRIMVKTYESGTKGKIRLVTGIGVKGNKTENYEIVCINPSINRSQGLNLSHVKGIESILDEHFKGWLRDAK